MALDPISKLLGMPEYYLDTNAVRRLVPMLKVGTHERLLTSIYTIVELIGNIKDEQSFQRQKSILDKLALAKIRIDPLLPEVAFMEAFNIHINTDVSSQIIDMMSRIVAFDTYNHWTAYELQQTPHPNIYEYVQQVDNEQTFAKFLSIHHTDNPDRIAEFNDIWAEDKSRDEILTRIVNYYIDKRKSAFPDKASDIRYDSTINLFLLVHAYYVGKKVTYHDHPGRNDFQDLMHLLYVRQGMTLVTDDRHFRELVNTVWKGRAITVDEFTQIYKETL